MREVADVEHPVRCPQASVTINKTGSHRFDILRTSVLKRLLCIIITLGLGDLMAGGGSSDTSSSVVQEKGSIAEL